MNIKKLSREAIILIIITGLFLLVSFLTSRYSPFIASWPLADSMYSEAIFVAIVIAEVIFAPTSVIPLLPLAVNLWGLDNAIVLTTIGWTIGSLGAFGIARTFGRRVVCYFFEDRYINEWAELLPKKELFGFLILARIFLPIDMVSYAVGIFTNFTWPAYFFATLIGSSVSATIFSLGAGLPLAWQFIAGIGAILFTVFYYEKFKRNFKKLLS